ncbi:MAG: tRNA (N6-threonylcarbamoyladenosine(37)-N6)-methyltransferase TrmO [Methanospirillum sp.]|nr:tRNA (N6-threonylcarbamoyladenosine(37)-N6)-methyltransferase TrmO [Methanospirillum sp.]
MAGHQEITYEVIGVVRSRSRTVGAPPIQSVFSAEEGIVEVYPEFREGLVGIEGFSHLILVYHFDRAERCALVELPLTDAEEPHGIFATRHFNRPNPIGLSCVTLMGVEDGVLRVAGLDILDGTPLLDIKPYIPAFDSVPGAVPGWVTPRHVGRVREAGRYAPERGARSPRTAPEDRC